jgi:thymidylate synthase (FAD)
MPWNEVSRRYVDDEPEFYMPDIWRARPEGSVKQGSVGEVDIGWLQHDINYYNIEQPLGLYNQLLHQGVAPEQARMVLPQNTMTEWYWSGTLGAFADMLVLRLDAHAQQESREVAEKIRDKLLPLFPVSLKALLEN